MMDTAHDAMEIGRIPNVDFLTLFTFPDKKVLPGKPAVIFLTLNIILCHNVSPVCPMVRRLRVIPNFVIRDATAY
jgi:hypothetical protein